MVILIVTLKNDIHLCHQSYLLVREGGGMRSIGSAMGYISPNYIMFGFATVTCTPLHFFSFKSFLFQIGAKLVQKSR